MRNFNTYSHHLNCTPTLRAHIQNKLTHILQRYDIIDTQVKLSAEPLCHTAEITMHLKGKGLYCKARNKNLYTAINLLAAKLARRLVSYKAKLKNHTAAPIKRHLTPA